MTNDITLTQNQHVFDNSQTFENAQRMAKALCCSTLVPKKYKDNLPNCLLALEVAMRVGASPLMVMQNLYIVHGNPAWSAQYILAALNSSKKFTPVQFDIKTDEKEKTITYFLDAPKKERKDYQNPEKIKKQKTFVNKVCIAHMQDKDGNKYESTPVSLEMAMREGWYDKPGSKWQTMPDLMLRYRAASFLGKIYIPEKLMGIQSYEEIQDISDGNTIKEVSPEKTNQSKDIASLLGDNAEVQNISETVEPKEKIRPFKDTNACDIPCRTQKDLKIKSEECIARIEDGNDKIETINLFGGDDFFKDLGRAGLGKMQDKIKEL